jgi:hypothetical protein
MTNYATSYDCLTAVNLAPIDFIGGTEQTLNFYIYDQTSACALDITSATCSVLISPFGDPSHVSIEALGVPSGSPVNHFYAILSGSSTQDLSGKFTQQPKIIDYEGKPFYPGMGYITIFARNTTS